MTGSQRGPRVWAEKWYVLTHPSTESLQQLYWEEVLDGKHAKAETSIMRLLRDQGEPVQNHRSGGEYEGGFWRYFEGRTYMISWLNGYKERSQGWLWGLLAWATARIEFTSTVLELTISNAGWGRGVQRWIVGLGCLLSNKHEFQENKWISKFEIWERALS